MHRRQIQPLIALAIALSLAPTERAAAQIRSAVATVQLTAVVPPAASFRVGDGSGVGPSVVGTGTGAPGLTVNAPYRLEVHQIRGPAITLVPNGRPGAVPLQALRGNIRAAGLEDDSLPVTVDLVLEPTL